MLVKMKRAAMGHPPNTIVEVRESLAADWIHKGIAIQADAPAPDPDPEPPLPKRESAPPEDKSITSKDVPVNK